LLDKGLADLVVVLTPSEEVKFNWAKNLEILGGMPTIFDLSGRTVRDHPRLGLPTDARAIALTYQLLSQPSIADALAKLCRQRQVLVILDEIHHGTEGLAWGDSSNTAFLDARFVLALSGTMYRTDKGAITFVPYTDYEGTADFSYGYDEALRDNHVRALWFRWVGAEIAYEDSSSPGGVKLLSFTDDLSTSDRSDLLAACQSAHSPYLLDLIAEAQEQLDLVRKHHPDAGGLVTVSSIETARWVHEELRNRGHSSVLTTSKDSSHHKAIDVFREGSQEWLVSVAQVSEGVDIPRLRVGVYATNIRTELAYRQWVARMIRVIPEVTDPLQHHAYIFGPWDPELVLYAEEIAIQRISVLGNGPPPSRPDPASGKKREGRYGLERLPNGHLVLTSNVRGEGATFGTETVTEAEINARNAFLMANDGIPAPVKKFLMEQPVFVRAGLQPHIAKSRAE
jgi:superfamily II DNA or RNA helicase